MAFEKGNMYWKLRSRHGRNKKYKDAEELWKDCEGYFKFMDENPFEYQDNKGTKNVNTIQVKRPYTLHSLCLYLDIQRPTWCEWRKKDHDFSKVVHKVDDIIYNQKFEGAAIGLYNSNIIIRDLGLAEKRDYSSTDGTMRPQIVVQNKKAADELDKMIDENN